MDLCLFYEAELITSCHNIIPITLYLSTLKLKYEQFYNQKCNFRLIVTDFAWVLMHAVVDVFNRQTIAEYAQVVFAVSKQPSLIDTQFAGRSWLISCVSHTMKRVTGSLKKLHIPTHSFRYAAFTFSLLLNSTHLDMATEVFRQMCIVFLTPTLTAEVTTAKTKLNTLLDVRPESLFEMTKIYRAAGLRFDLSQLETNFNEDFADSAGPQTDDALDSDDRPDNDDGLSTDEEEGEVEEEREEDITVKKAMPDEFSSGTIKSNSPFTAHFREIETTVRRSLSESSSSSPSNIFYSTDIITYFVDSLMPYIFLWGAFILHGTNVTRITNGVIEQYQGQVKRNSKKNLMPHAYITEHYQTVFAKCELYQTALLKQANPVSVSLLLASSQFLINWMINLFTSSSHRKKES